MEFKDQKIILIDDEQGICEILEEYLKAEGYNISTYTSWKKAKEVVFKEIPDLIFVDIFMDVNGFDVVRELKQYEEFADVPIVIMTGASDEAYIEEAFEMGVYDYLSKPIRFNELSVKVENFLKLRYFEKKIKES